MSAGEIHRRHEGTKNAVVTRGADRATANVMRVVLSLNMAGVGGISAVWCPQKHEVSPVQVGLGASTVLVAIQAALAVYATC